MECFQKAFSHRVPHNYITLFDEHGLISIVLRLGGLCSVRATSSKRWASACSWSTSAVSPSMSAAATSNKPSDCTSAKKAHGKYSIPSACSHWFVMFVHEILSLSKHAQDKPNIMHGNWVSITALRLPHSEEHRQQVDRRQAKWRILVKGHNQVHDLKPVAVHQKNKHPSPRA